MVERELKCKRCSKFVPIVELRMEPDGKSYLCNECRANRTPQTAIKQNKTPVGVPVGGPRISKYQCVKCHHMFKRSATVDAVCPICAGTKLIKYEKLDADKIIKLSEDKRFENL